MKQFDGNGSAAMKGGALPLLPNRQLLLLRHQTRDNGMTAA
jgi:hypothetical protein